MPTLKITDNFGLTLDANADLGSVFNKYLKSPDAILGALGNIKPIKDLRISDDPFQSQAVGIAFKEPVALGNTGIELTIRPSLNGTISIVEGESLFAAESDPFRQPLPIPAEHAYLAAALSAEVATDAAGKISGLQFGFTAGTNIVITNYRMSALTDPVLPAMKQLFADFTLPGDLEDIFHLGEHDVLTLEGTGSLQFTANANLLTAANPLATLNTPFVPIAVAQGGSVSINATYSLKGIYQLRIERLSDRRFSLAYHKKRTTEFGVTVEAQVNTEVRAGGFDLIKNVLQAVSSDTVPDKDVFHQGGLTDDQISTIAAALKTGIERSIALSLSGSLDALDSSSTAFSYEIDAGLLDESDRKAVHEALHGDLSGLEAADHAGVKRRISIFETLRQGKHVLRISLLGIFNHASVSTLFQNGTIIVDRETGDVTITDRVGANRIQFTAGNFAENSAKLRGVLAESLLITAAYRCTNASTTGPLLASHYWFFALHQSTNLKQISDYLNIAAAFKLLSQIARTAKLTSIQSIAAFGRSTLYIDASYDDLLCKRMFLDRAGRPRPEEDHEQIGRDALLALVPADDPGNARRVPLTDGALWKIMKQVGQPGFQVLFTGRGFNANQIADIVADYTLIRWWASSMHRMGEALADIQTFIAANPGVDRENNTFKQLRNELDSAMASVVSNTQPQFGEPWGALALDLASDQQGTVSLQMVTPRTTLILTERAAQDAIGHGD